MALVCSQCGQKYSERTLSGEPRLYCTICRLPLPGAEQAAAARPASPKPVAPAPKTELPPPATALAAVVTPVGGRTVAVASGATRTGRQLGPMERWAVLIAGWFFLLMAPLWALGGVWMALQAAETHDWPSTTGTVIACQLAISPNVGRYTRHIKSFVLELTYTYSVDGTEYQGHRVSVADSKIKESEALMLQSKYSPGSEHEVYYDPDDPTRCVLEHLASPWDDRVFVCLGVVLPAALFLLGPLMIGIFYWTRPA
ncbi:MAG TPA: DUF3592 domain-containing protein [Pirellulaceae bacterium]|nr:DUF3592 domain-containing protein [Pirellulaceae bacterium]